MTASKLPTAIVTGAAGFIGSHLVERLLSEAYEVVGVDSFEDYYARDLKLANLAAVMNDPHFRLVDRNIIALSAADGSNGQSELRSLLGASQFVFHLAAQAGVRASWGASFRAYTDNNVLATQMVLEACREAGVERFIFASSSSVYGDTDELPLREDALCRPLSPYGVTKLAGEHLCRLYHRSYGVPTVALRFFTVYGPRQRPDMAFNKFIRAALDGRPVEIYGDGRQTRDFTYVDDIVTGILLARKAPPGSVINLGGGSRVTLIDALNVIEAAVGKTLPVKTMPEQAGDVRHTWSDLTRAQEILGFAPRTSLEAGLKAELTWISRNLDVHSMTP